MFIRKQITSVELPLNVKNPDKAIERLGGKHVVSQKVSGAELLDNPPSLELKIRDNSYHHPVVSNTTKSNNLVVSLSFPKEHHRADLRESVAEAKKNDAPIKVTPKFTVGVKHRFIAMADFQYYTGDSQLATDLDKSILSGNLDNIEGIDFSKYEAENDFIPPPRFSVNTQPFYYGYKQSPYVQVVSDDKGGQKLLHKAASTKVVSNIVSWNDEVPLKPPTGLEESPKPAIKECIDVLIKLFDEQPSYTRRSLQYKLGATHSRQLKYALPYVAYYFKSGPWRGAYVKYGKNPKTDASMAIYQVEHFRIIPSDGMHVSFNINDGCEFDGTSYPVSPMLQLCDIRDGFLEGFINSKDFRSQVDSSDGWYNERTMNVIRRVLRAELVALSETKNRASREDIEEIIEAAILEK